jgi:hypothetical protein
LIQKENRKVYIGKLRSAQNMDKVLKFLKEGVSESLKRKEKNKKLFTQIWKVKIVSI